MAQYIADRRDVEFVLYEQLEAEKLTKLEQYSDLNKKAFDMVVNEARNFAIKEILPTYAEGDKNPVRYENGRVIAPPSFKRPLELFRDGEWIALSEDPEIGGQGLPILIAQAAREYLIGANFAFAAYAVLGHGTGKMIELYGTDLQKKMFLKNLYTGKWAGTMVLTEANAGSDLGALTTTATKNPDGTYNITGNKIFITNGDQDLTENIIHPVLARIEGAPAGTRGISLFIVPKFWVNEDGSIGEYNDVACTGIEEKMGLHGSPTCSLAFGSKGKCRGLLLGEENKGIRVMFHMMNEARLGVGLQGLNHGSSAYLYAVNYARERLQGKELEKMMDADAPQTAIIRHPDVRRMLMWMKAHVDGMRSFIYYVGYLFDMEQCAKTPEEAERWKGLIDLLTPLVKAYCTDRGYDVCVQAMQVYGGYGYTKEYPVEQLTRDCKIASIYEGTNGIQAMDLLGRKLGMKKGAVVMEFLGEIQKTIAVAKNIEELADMAAKLEAAVNRFGETAMHIGKTAMSAEFKTAFANAYPFMEAMGDLIMAWMHLWRATIAVPKLKTLAGGLDAAVIAEKAEKNKDVAFYDGLYKTATYYINSILPVTLGRMNAVFATTDAVVTMGEKSFGGI
ncbi:MAG: acyl-CoA dehydrogenase [Desulfobacteraceae bacterium]|jgi:alkylation response protein AidB-like acyl-CoA dehydrogenase|nr:MAG: acyl-CoA dehydrogenase [Desulfobacteraceae bacterium]